MRQTDLLRLWRQVLVQCPEHELLNESELSAEFEIFKKNIERRLRIVLNNVPLPKSVISNETTPVHTVADASESDRVPLKFRIKLTDSNYNISPMEDVNKQNKTKKSTKVQRKPKPTMGQRKRKSKFDVDVKNRTNNAGYKKFKYIFELGPNQKVQLLDYTSCKSSSHTKTIPLDLSATMSLTNLGPLQDETQPLSLTKNVDSNVSVATTASALCDSDVSINSSPEDHTLSNSCLDMSPLPYDDHANEICAKTDCSANNNNENLPDNDVEIELDEDQNHIKQNCTQEDEAIDEPNNNNVVNDHLPDNDVEIELDEDQNHIKQNCTQEDEVIDDEPYNNNVITAKNVNDMQNSVLELSNDSSDASSDMLNERSEVDNVKKKQKELINIIEDITINENCKIFVEQKQTEETEVQETENNDLVDNSNDSDIININETNNQSEIQQNCDDNYEFENIPSLSPIRNNIIEPNYIISPICSDIDDDNDNDAAADDDNDADGFDDIDAISMSTSWNGSDNESSLILDDCKSLSGISDTENFTDSDSDNDETIEELDIDQNLNNQETEFNENLLNEDTNNMPFILNNEAATFNDTDNNEITQEPNQIQYLNNQETELQTNERWVNDDTNNMPLFVNNEAATINEDNNKITKKPYKIPLLRKSKIALNSNEMKLIDHPNNTSKLVDNNKITNNDNEYKTFKKSYKIPRLSKQVNKLISNEIPQNNDTSGTSMFDASLSELPKNVEKTNFNFDTNQRKLIKFDIEKTLKTANDLILQQSTTEQQTQKFNNLMPTITKNINNSPEANVCKPVRKLFQDTQLQQTPNRGITDNAMPHQCKISPPQKQQDLVDGSTKQYTPSLIDPRFVRTIQQLPLHSLLDTTPEQQTNILARIEFHLISPTAAKVMFLDRTKNNLYLAHVGGPFFGITCPAYLDRACHDNRNCGKSHDLIPMRQMQQTLYRLNSQQLSKTYMHASRIWVIYSKILFIFLRISMNRKQLSFVLRILRDCKDYSLDECAQFIRPIYDALQNCDISSMEATKIIADIMIDESMHRCPLIVNVVLEIIMENDWIEFDKVISLIGYLPGYNFPQETMSFIMNAALQDTQGELCKRVMFMLCKMNSSHLNLSNPENYARFKQLVTNVKIFENPTIVQDYNMPPHQHYGLQTDNN